MVPGGITGPAAAQPGETITIQVGVGTSAVFSRTNGTSLPWEEHEDGDSDGEISIIIPWTIPPGSKVTISDQGVPPSTIEIYVIDPSN